jgi:dethiobiotin synthetase
MATLFVTGSGTGIGKTFVCCRLLAALPPELRVRAIKPVVTGFADAAAGESDTGLLIRARGLPLNGDTIAATSPWRFRAPLSADMAAALEQRRIPFDELVEFSRAPPAVDLNLVEGIGGVMAPLDASHTVLDWIAALEAPALLVVGSYLGTLSHSLTAHAALRSRGVDVAAIVISRSAEEPVPAEDTAASLRHYIGVTPVTILPRDAQASAAAMAALLLRGIGRS